MKRAALLALAACGAHPIAAPPTRSATVPRGAVVFGEDVDPDRGLLRTTAWSPDGRFVLLPRAPAGNTRDTPLALEIVDSHTLGAVRIDTPGEPTWSPDGRALVMWADWKLSAIDPATGATILSPRATSTFDPYFAPDGRMVWAERTPAEDVVHLRDLARGGEEILRAPARPASKDPDAGIPAIDRIDFSRDGAVVVAVVPDDAPASWGAPGTIHVWRDRDHVIDLDALASPVPAIDASGAVAFAVPDGDDARLEVVPPGAWAPVGMTGTGPCGAGAMSRYASISACAPGRVLVSHGDTVCVWDVGARTLVAAIPTGGHPELDCADGKIVIGDGVPGTDTDDFSAVTGRPVGHGHIPVDLAEEHAQETMWIDRTDLAAIVVDNRSGTRVALADSARVGQADVAPDHARVLGIDLDGRARLWDAAGGQLIWAAPAVPLATQVAIDAHGELVVAAADGATWRFTPGARAVRTTPGSTTCPLRAVAADEDHAIVLCDDVTNGGPKLVVDGVVRDAPGAKALVTGPAGVEVLALDDKGLSALGALDGDARWHAAAPPRQDWDTSAAGDRIVWHDGARVFAADARGAELWHADPKVVSGPVVVSADGALVATGAVCQFGLAFELWDAATGAHLRKVASDGCAVAWDPTSARLAVWHAGAIEVTDARTGALVRLSPRRAPDRRVDSIAWSRDGASLAAVADGVVSLWKLGEPDPVATFAPSHAGVAAIFRDGSLDLLGDAADARAVLGCRTAARLAPLDACAPRVRSPSGARPNDQ